MNYESDYKKFAIECLTKGEAWATRNSTTISTFGTSLKIDSLRTGHFPILTSRKIYIKGIAGEMAAFLKGPTNVSDFKDQGCHYWDIFGGKDGELNLDYGNKWKNFNGVDQIQSVINKLINNKKDRRMIISSWDPASLDGLTLPCCHLLYQFHVDLDGRLNMTWYQRSVDVCIGLPSDVVLGALFIILMARATNLRPGTLTMFFGDTHIYTSHRTNLRNYLTASSHELPKYNLAEGSNILDFKPEDFELVNYIHNDPIKFELHG